MPNSAPMGRRLAELREHAAFTQQDLADAIGVSQSTIWQYERDRIRIPAARIAAASVAMHVPIRQFFQPAGSALPRLTFHGYTPKTPTYEFGYLLSRPFPTDEVQ